MIILIMLLVITLIIIDIITDMKSYTKFKKGPGQSKVAHRGIEPLPLP